MANTRARDQRELGNEDETYTARPADEFDAERRESAMPLSYPKERRAGAITGNFEGRYIDGVFTQ